MMDLAWPAYFFVAFLYRVLFLPYKRATALASRTARLDRGRFHTANSLEATLRGFGFGLEGLGLLVLRWPRLVAALILVSLVICVASVPRLSFDGNILNVLASNSEAFRNYRSVQSEFRDFSGDLGVIIRSDTLYEPEDFEQLREFHLDLTITDGVEGVFSLFTSSRIDPETGAIAPAIPEVIEPGTDIKALLREAARDNPLVAQLSRPDRNAALISLETVFSERNGRAPDPAPVHRLVNELRAMAPPQFTVDFVGYPLIRADSVGALISDQKMLTMVGIVTILLIALLTFRSPLPALICAAPAMTAVAWVLGGYALTGSAVNYLSIALPTIAMVLALADSVMLYFAWAARREAGMENRSAIGSAIRHVGPANALTSITTAIAFGSFVLGGNPAMRSLAVLGSSAVLIAFVATMVMLPTLLYFLGERINATTKRSIFAPLGPLTARFAAWRPGRVALTGIIACLVLSSGHFLGTEQHRVAAQLPADSQAVIGENLARDIFGGVAPIYLTLPVPEGMQWTDEEALDRLARAEEAFAQALGSDGVFSLSQIRDQGLAPAAIEEAFADAPDNLTGRFVSHDRTRYLVTGSAPFGMPSDVAAAVAHDVVGQLAREGIEGAQVTGYPILASIEIPRIVRALKQSLIAAIVLGIVVMAVASRQPVIAAAALLPNLIPVLFIETVLWLMNIPMDVPHIIALTIAFGISIDNAIHVINAFVAAKRDHGSDEVAMDIALREVSPALVAASFMFVAGCIGTVFSSLPSVANMGFLIIATLSVALIVNLALLPALMLTFRRAIARFEGARQSEQMH